MGKAARQSAAAGRRARPVTAMPTQSDSHRAVAVLLNAPAAAEIAIVIAVTIAATCDAELVNPTGSCVKFFVIH